MGASILWRYVTPETHKSLGVGARSAFLQAMEKAFGSSYPWIVGPSNDVLLQGMEAAWNDKDNPFTRMRELILSGTIEVWAEY